MVVEQKVVEAEEKEEKLAEEARILGSARVSDATCKKFWQNR